MERQKQQNLTRLKDYLERIVCFSEAAWSAAEPCFLHRDFTAGSHILEAGTRVSVLYFLSDGLARYYYLRRNGKEFNKSFARAGQVLSSSKPSENAA